MTPDRWQQIEQLYHSALKREGSQRAAFLREACGGDESLRREVESLLAQQSEAKNFIETPAAKMLAETPSLLGHEIGSYKIFSLLGSGGMGQVYRARDAKLGREVAIKVLPREFSSDLERVRRFEQEARAASALNHPNIITIHEIGQVEMVHYMVIELVEGKTLREVLAAGPVPIKRTLHISTQVADGLAKAHGAGITHRDLKPENLMITKEGLVKILDFGLAKQAGLSTVGAGSEVATIGDVTEPGVLLGTVGYMSPEQARGQVVNFQSDQFSFGAIVYEMVTGERAFARGSAPETLSAIIREEPRPITERNPKTPMQLRWVIERCLAKDAEDRYASTRDLARELQTVRDHLTELVSGEPAGQPVATLPAGVRRFRVLGAISVAVVLLALLAFISFHRPVRLPSAPTINRLTFHHGNIIGAKLAADGQTVVYGAKWAGKPSELYTTRPESPESRSLGLQGAGIFSISRSGEMAVGLGCTLHWGMCIGTLARVPLAGGTPRELLPSVISADWAPDGNSLAVAWFKGQQCRLEYPVAKLLYETPGWINFVRVSPKGDLIAFLDYPIIKDASGSVCVVDLTGKKTTLSTGWKGLFGVAWSLDGNEIWFSGSRVGKGESLDLHAVTLLGQERLIYSAPTLQAIQDISRDGLRVLILRGSVRSALMSLAPGSSKEHDLAWFDYASAADLSADGRTLLFYEWGDAVKGINTVYLRKTDGSDPVRLGEGKPLALSPDGKWALVVQQSQPPQLVLLPTGSGEQKPLPRGAISEYKLAGWFPDGRQIFFSGTEVGHRPRTYVQDIESGEPRPVTDEGMEGGLLSPDGKLIAAMGRYSEYYLCPIAGGEPHPVEGLEDGDTLLQWSGDGRSLFVRAAGDLVLKIYKVDLASGRRELWKELNPPDPGGLIDVGSSVGEVRITPDGKSYVYTSWTAPGELYLVEGLK
jgi:WD40 repeat protein